MKTPFWTESKARLQCFQSNAAGNFNWLLLPGGPGLGSESLISLTEILHLPGNVWLVDLPGDGSNLTENDTEYFSHWSQALIEVTNTFPKNKTILVAHSSGGMFALATPEIEKNLTGLILMDSAPNASWQDYFAKYVADNPLPDAEKLQALYDAQPSNETLKKLTIACAPYFSTRNSVEKIIAIMESLPFNYKTHQWASKHFDLTYQAKWIPKTLPTLIFAGDQDHLTPLKLFSEHKDFQRENIVICEIENASHFPWLDNPEKIKQVFAEYCAKLIKR